MYFLLLGLLFFPGINCSASDLYYNPPILDAHSASDQTKVAELARKLDSWKLAVRVQAEQDALSTGFFPTVLITHLPKKYRQPFNQLLNAIKSGDNPQLTSLLSDPLVKTLINVQSDGQRFGFTPLHYAIACNHVDTAETLLLHGAHVDVIGQGNIELTKRRSMLPPIVLLEHLNRQDSHQVADMMQLATTFKPLYLLQQAVKNGDCKQLAALFTLPGYKECINTPLRWHHNRTLLYDAIHSKHRNRNQVVQCLLAHDANPNWFNSTVESPYTLAFKRARATNDLQDWSMVTVMLESKKVRSIRKYTPIKQCHERQQELSERGLLNRSMDSLNQLKIELENCGRL